MSKQKFEPILLASEMSGNGSSFYVSKLLQVGETDYDLEIYEQKDTEQKIETVKIERQKIEVQKIRVIAGKLSIDEIEKRSKTLQNYLKKNTLEDAISIDKKTKKMIAEIDLNFAIERYFEEELILVEIPLIKSETIQTLEHLKTFSFLTRLRSVDIRNTVQAYINKL